MLSKANLIYKTLFRLFFRGALFGLLALPLFSMTTFAATIKNSGDKAIIVIMVEGTTHRDYSVDPQKQISFCVKGCFITLANGDRYAFSGDEVLEISGSRINFQ